MGLGTRSSKEMKLCLMSDDRWVASDLSKWKNFYTHTSEVVEIVTMAGYIIYSKDKNRVGRTLYGEKELTQIMMSAVYVE